MIAILMSKGVTLTLMFGMRVWFASEACDGQCKRSSSLVRHPECNGGNYNVQLVTSFGGPCRMSMKAFRED